MMLETPKLHVFWRHSRHVEGLDNYDNCDVFYLFIFLLRLNFALRSIHARNIHLPYWSKVRLDLPYAIFASLQLFYNLHQSTFTYA